MKIFLSLLAISFSFCTCSSSIVNKGCNENKEFKTEFFKNIANVEKLIAVDQNKSFNNSLVFISKYVHVSFEDRANYAHIYPTGSLTKDKKVWLSWYEANKCNNILLK